MKSLLLLAIVAVTIQVHAGNLNLDMRSDMLSQDYNDAALAGGAGTGVDNYRFYIQTGRVDYKGSLNEKISFRLRIRFAGKDQTAMAKRDSSDATLDFANAAYKLSDLVSVTVGKYGSDIGGFEGTTPGPDLYFTSEAFSGGGFLGTGQGTSPANGLKLGGYANLIYLTGAKLAFVFNDLNTINLMVGDLDAATGRSTNAAYIASDVLQGGNTSQNKSLLGASYFGNFMDKTLAVIASYHAQTIAEDVSSTFSSLGLGYTMGPVAIQANYSLNAYNSIVGAFKPKDQLNSAVLKVTYTIDPTLSAQVKITSSDEKFDQSSATAIAATNKYTGYGAAIEWKPKADDVFRYHAAYQSRNETPDNGGDSRQLTEAIVGMRIYADFMK